MIFADCAINADPTPSSWPTSPSLRPTARAACWATSRASPCSPSRPRQRHPSACRQGARGARHRARRRPGPCRRRRAAGRCGLSRAVAAKKVKERERRRRPGQRPDLPRPRRRQHRLQAGPACSAAPPPSAPSCRASPGRSPTCRAAPASTTSSSPAPSRWPRRETSWDVFHRIEHNSAYVTV